MAIDDDRFDKYYIEAEMFALASNSIWDESLPREGLKPECRLEIGLSDGVGISEFSVTLI